MTQEVTLYCTKCGSRITDGQCKNNCDSQNRGPLSPSQRVRCNQIPGIIGSKLTGIQSDGLAFGVKKVLVKSAVIQSFNLGARSSGNVKIVGAARSFGPWAVFGGMGSIQQMSVNSYPNRHPNQIGGRLRAESVFGFFTAVRDNPFHRSGRFSQCVFCSGWFTEADRAGRFPH